MASTVSSTITENVLTQKKTVILNNTENVTKNEDDAKKQCDDKKKSDKPEKTNFLKAWEKKMGFETELIWGNIAHIAFFHSVTVGWLGYNLATGNAPKWQSLLYAYIMTCIAMFGLTGGVHRLWSHRTYRATLPLQWILIICYSVAGQNTIYDWVRDHRVHHKYSDTAADPHNPTRGFFFAHVGWLMMKKNHEVLKRGKAIDMSDIENDPLVQFHTKHFVGFKLLCCFILPTIVPPLAWGETWGNAILTQAFLRFVCSSNATWAINSFAHLWGNKPYDPNIKPADNWIVSLTSMGEGWHNYHHTFPWDYKTAELPYTINPTTFLLDAFSLLNWSHSFKQASPSLIRSVSQSRTNKLEHST